MQLRPYQQKIIEDNEAAWDSGVQNIVDVLPTGGGKTVVFCEQIKRKNVPSLSIAHRQELVGQMSMTLARNEIEHRVIAPEKLVRALGFMQREDFGHNFIHNGADIGVGGVLTVNNRAAEQARFYKRVKFLVQDECHHVTKDNQWGKVFTMFDEVTPGVQMLGVTATPLRADGKGLGRHASGWFDKMIVGPSMRSLIRDGYLTDYRVYVPPNDLNLDDVNITASGDYNQKKLAKATKQSHITGDIVSHYKKLAYGKLGVTFVPDVEMAHMVAEQFNSAGIPAAVVTAKSTDEERRKILKAFKERKIWQLINVDLFGEGFDLPAIEVVQMARKTESYGLYVQQFGRALRLLEGKEFAIIIDHVGNVIRHGLPDAPREWTLDNRDKRGSSKADDAIPMTVCIACESAYERFHNVCPYCGEPRAIADRSKPEFVDGELMELDPQVLAQMRGEADAVFKPYSRKSMNPKIDDRHRNYHFAKQDAQRQLRAVMDQWAGFHAAMGRTKGEWEKLFYWTFDLDVLNAQSLGVSDAEKLCTKLNIEINKLLIGHYNEFAAMGNKVGYSLPCN